MELKNLLIAHRGIHDNIDTVENTILAFKKAIKNNFSIEFDINMTKDNELIIFHDDDLYRLTKSNKNINELNYKEIKEIKLLNTNQTIPTFREALKIINGKVPLIIEIKKCKDINLICKKIVQELDKYNGEFIIKSFSPKIIRWFYKNKKEYTRGLLIKNNYYNTIYRTIIFKYCKPQFISISKKYIDKNGIKNGLKKYPILIWTIKDSKEMNKYKKISNNYICNNLPFIK